MVTGAGGVRDLRRELPSALWESLSNGLIWVQQSEPSTLSGWGPDAPALLAIQPSGGAIVQAYYYSQGQLESATDRERPTLEGADFARAFGDSVGRYDFLAVYSRSEGRVFLLGGVDADGASQGTILQRQMGQDAWSTVPEGQFALETVMAATYNVEGKMLWILDEHTINEHDSERRLLLVDPRTGEARTVGLWASAGSYESYQLAADRDGSVLLVASSALLGEHAIFRLRDVDGVLEVEGMTAQRGILSHALVVDTSGYWVMATIPGEEYANVQRLSALEMSAAQVRDLEPYL